MEYTGERMMPDHSDGGTFWEHVHRYRFAARHVAGKRVLDIACGEGYGTKALEVAKATQVIGIDVAEETVLHARTQYGIDARLGDAEAIPLDDASMDVVVSFETIEHVPNPAKFLDECARVLKPGGTLICSTPEKTIYDQISDNPFHLSEMTEDELGFLIAQRFEQVQWYSQSLMTANWWSGRSMSAIKTGWKRVKGFGRIARLCPHYYAQVTDKQRADIVGTILGSEGPASAWFDPYALRPRARWTGEQPTYLVVTAVKR